MPRLFALLCAGLMACVAVDPAWAEPTPGLVIRQRINISGMQRPDREQTLYYTPGIRIIDDERMRSIIDLDARTFTVIDKEGKTYAVSTFEALEGRGGRHDDRIKAMPPEVRAMVLKEDPLKITATGGAMTIGGYETREFKVESARMDGKVWIAADLDASARGAEWEKIATLFGGLNTPGSQLDRELAKHQGVVLRRQIRIDPLPLVTTEALEVRREAPPPALLEIPSGFTLVDAEQMLSRRKPTPYARTPLPTPVLTTPTP